MFTLLPIITNTICLTKIDPWVISYPTAFIVCALSIYLIVKIVPFIALVFSLKQYFCIIYCDITVFPVALIISLIAYLCPLPPYPSPTLTPPSVGSSPGSSIGFTCHVFLAFFNLEFFCLFWWLDTFEEYSLPLSFYSRPFLIFCESFFLSERE